MTDLADHPAIRLTRAHRINDRLWVGFCPFCSPLYRDGEGRVVSIMASGIRCHTDGCDPDKLKSWLTAHGCDERAIELWLNDDRPFA
jgi:hypothetical protein